MYAVIMKNLDQTQIVQSHEMVTSIPKNRYNPSSTRSASEWLGKSSDYRGVSKQLNPAELSRSSVSLSNDQVMARSNHVQSSDIDVGNAESDTGMDSEKLFSTTEVRSTSTGFGHDTRNLRGTFLFPVDDEGFSSIDCFIEQVDLTSDTDINSHADSCSIEIDSEHHPSQSRLSFDEANGHPDTSEDAQVPDSSTISSPSLVPDSGSVPSSQTLDDSDSYIQAGSIMDVDEPDIEFGAHQPKASSGKCRQTRLFEFQGWAIRDKIKTIEQMKKIAEKRLHPLPVLPNGGKRKRGRPRKANIGSTPDSLSNADKETSSRPGLNLLPNGEKRKPGRPKKHGGRVAAVPPSN